MLGLSRLSRAVISVHLGKTCIGRTAALLDMFVRPLRNVDTNGFSRACRPDVQPTSNYRQRRKVI